MYRADVPKAVYHVTSKNNADKIIEFGFDLDLAGQGTIQRFRKSKHFAIDDDFVIKREIMFEHSAINTSCNPVKGFGHDTNCVLQITLKPDAKILDRKKIVIDTSKLPKSQRWSLIFAFAKENGFDGILNGDYLLIFRNKIISKIEKIAEGESRI